MLGAAIIVFREVFEAGLIIGIVMAVTRGIAYRTVYVYGGVTAGIVGACVVAMFAGAVSAAFSGAGQELFNAAILGLAVVMLTWHNVWMARHGRELAAEMAAAGAAVASGSKSLAGLAIVVAVAVLREGVEIVLFLYGIAVSGGDTAAAIFSGSAIGLVLAGAVCALTYWGLVSVPSRYLFNVTSLMIALVAAGMAAQAVAFLEQADAVTAFGTIVWDTSGILSEKSIVGRALHTLVGYADQPTVLQFATYLATIAVMVILMRLFAPPPRTIA